MKKAKLIKTNKKEEKQMEKETYSLKNLLLIILILVITFGIFYLITTLVVDPVQEQNINNTPTQIDATKITLSNLLNRKENEYYVLATKESDNDKVNYIELYNNAIQEYSKAEKALPFYNVDLNDALNKNYISEELNISDEISEIKLNDEALFKVKDGKIEKYFVGSKDIIKALSKLKES